MPRLIGVFVGRTGHFDGFIMRCSNNSQLICFPSLPCSDELYSSLVSRRIVGGEGHIIRSLASCPPDTERVCISWNKDTIKHSLLVNFYIKCRYFTEFQPVNRLFCRTYFLLCFLMPGEPFYPLKVERWAEWGFFRDHNFTLKCNIHNSSAL